MINGRNRSLYLHDFGKNGLVEMIFQSRLSEILLIHVLLVVQEEDPSMIILLQKLVFGFRLLKQTVREELIYLNTRFITFILVSLFSIFKRLQTEKGFLIGQGASYIPKSPESETSVLTDNNGKFKVTPRPRGQFFWGGGGGGRPSLTCGALRTAKKGLTVVFY